MITPNVAMVSGLILVGTGRQAASGTCAHTMHRMHTMCEIFIIMTIVVCNRKESEQAGWKKICAKQTGATAWLSPRQPHTWVKGKLLLPHVVYCFRI